MHVSEGAQIISKNSETIEKNISTENVIQSKTNIALNSKELKKAVKKEVKIVSIAKRAKKIISEKTIKTIENTKNTFVMNPNNEDSKNLTIGYDYAQKCIVLEKQFFSTKQNTDFYYY